MNLKIEMNLDNIIRNDGNFIYAGRDQIIQSIRESLDLLDFAASQDKAPIEYNQKNVGHILIG